MTHDLIIAALAIIGLIVVVVAPVVGIERAAERTRRKEGR